MAIAKLVFIDIIIMNKEDLFRKIGAILEDLNSQYTYLYAHPEHWNELELSLFQANADFLSDHVQVLFKACAQEEGVPVSGGRSVSDEAEISGIDAALVDIPKEVTVARTEEPDEQPVASFEFILNRRDENVLGEEPSFQDENSVLDEAFDAKLNQIANTFRRADEEDEIGPEPYLISDTSEMDGSVFFPTVEQVVATEAEFEEREFEMPKNDELPKPTLNDRLGAKAEKQNTTLSNPAMVSDLKQVISLNDKLLFIKDLFNGYNLAYAEAIELANRLPDFEAADNFFRKTYAEQNNWADKQATVDKFYVLLHRRFG